MFLLRRCPTILGGGEALKSYEFTSESTVEIHANSSMHPIHGETHEVKGSASGEVQDGQIVLEPQPQGYFEIPVDAMKSGHKLQDMEMRRRIHAKQYPTIRYELVRIEGGPDEFDVTGKLTFHGVSREFTEKVRARVEDGTLYAEGEHTLNLNDYDMKPPKILNLQVYPEVRVVVRVVAKEV